MYLILCSFLMQLGNLSILYYSDICHQVLDLYSPKKKENELTKPDQLKQSSKSVTCEKPDQQKQAVSSTQLCNYFKY